jgi:hypothetical protein
MGGEVHHRVNSREHGPEPGFIGDVALHQFKASRQAAEAGGEIVIDRDLIARAPQRPHRMTADVARTAHDQDRQ